MRFSMLGPIEVRAGEGPLPLGGPRQRSLLAALLLHANEVVSRDELIDAIWGERPPASVQQSLDSYVSRLRRELGGERIERRSPGYLIRVADGELDVQRFESLVAMAREADPEAAASLLRQALALWRGAALADVIYQPFAQDAARRFEEQRLDGLEARIDADLARSRDGELVAELKELVVAHPLREAFAGQLMLALYRAGRQADALAVFQATRRQLVEELGLEPGPALRQLQAEILRHDPSLGRSAPKSGLARRAGRRGIAIGAAALALAALASLAVALPFGASGGGANAARGAPDTVDRLVAISTASKRIEPGVSLPNAVGSLTSGAGSLWLSDAGSNSVDRIDPATGATVDRIPVGGEPGQTVSADGAIWVARTLGGAVSRIDPATDNVTQTVRLGGANPAALAYGEGHLWIGDPAAHSLLDVDARTGTLRRSLPLDVGPVAVAVGAGAVWVAGQDGSRVEKLDPRSGRKITSIPVGQGPSALVSGDRALWSANTLDGTVSRIDPDRARVTQTIAVGSDPSAIVAGDGPVWVANADSGTVVGIDPRRGGVNTTMRVGGRPTFLAQAGGKLWVGTGAAANAHRGGTLRLATTNRWRSVDPAFYQWLGLTQFMGLAYDTLLTRNHVDGPRGLQLVPDLAVALPTVSAGGATYSFRLRPNIHYSDGQLVLASDFRRAIERLYQVDSQGANRFAGILGAGACRPGVRCDLSRGVSTDDSTGRVTFHLSAPDPDFPNQLALSFAAPIPPGTPNRDMGPRPISGTGPYRIMSVRTSGIRLVRNTRFREWSRAAQPNGLPDEIVWRFARSRKAVVNDVIQGRADWTLDSPSATALRELFTHEPSQLHVNPSTIFEFLPLNTHRSPFDDVRVRRALNYAIDRGRIARMYGGPAVASPSCQPLVPGIPGYRRYCPYTRDPRPGGAWTRPDLRRARALVAGSGKLGQHVDVWGPTDEVAVPRQLPPYVAEVLRSIGFHARLHLSRIADIPEPTRMRMQLSADGDWGAEFPSASAYLPEFFGCSGGTSNGYVCDRALDRQMRAATMAQFSSARRAAALWTRVDHQLVDDALWVPTVRLNAVELVSKRLGGYQFNPVTGFLADQAWVRGG